MRLDDVVALIRKERRLSREVPGFDPENGNEQARFLLVLEAPGPRAVETGYISFDNPDPSARNMKSQLDRAGIKRKDICLWNIVPWFLSEEGERRIRDPKSHELREGLRYLLLVVEAIPRLEAIVLVGRRAREAHLALSAGTNARILTCHHTSALSMNSQPERDAENLQVFKRMALLPKERLAQ